MSSLAHDKQVRWIQEKSCCGYHCGRKIFSLLDNLPLNVTGFRSDAEHPVISAKEDGDIVIIAAKYLGLSYDHHKTMLSKLHQRRREVMSTPAWKGVLGARKQKALLEAWENRAIRDGGPLVLGWLDRFGDFKKRNNGPPVAS